MKSRSLTHKGLNMKGIGPRSFWASNSSLIGLWSEMLQGSICILASRPKRRKELCTKNRSSLAAMCPGPTLLLDQVYLPEEGLMSSRSQSYMRSSTQPLTGSLMMLPPRFSDESKVRFRSPTMMMFSSFSVSARFLMESQQAFFSPTFTGTYILKRRMTSLVSRCQSFKKS